MTDTINISEMVQHEIKTAVDRHVQSVLDSGEWQSTMEQHITDFVKDRITTRFQNISTVPDLVVIVKSSVERMFNEGQIPSIEKFVDSACIRSAIDAAVQELVTNSMDYLLQDAAWIEKIQQHAEITMATRVTQRLSEIDINSEIAKEVAVCADKWRAELTRDFASTGIRDLATRCAVVVSDDGVVIQPGLACDTVLIEKDLTVTNLVVRGTVNTDCESWNELAHTVSQRTQALLGQDWQQSLVSQVLDLARTQGIEFDSINLEGSPLVQGDRLNASITETSIQSLGRLKNLVVQGNTRLADTMHVNNHRVGINTDQPDMALTIWDEEVSVSLGKISRDRAWIGTARNQTLDIGTNRRRAVSIEPDGLVVVDRLRLDRWRLSFGNAVPNYSGTRGDLVINHDPRPGTPFAWQCLGAYQWQPIETR